MLVFEEQEIKFIKGYKHQSELEIIQLDEYLKKNRNNVMIPKVFIDKAENRLQDLEFLYHIFEKLEKEVN